MKSIVWLVWDIISAGIKNIILGKTFLMFYVHFYVMLLLRKRGYGKTAAILLLCFY